MSAHTPGPWSVGSGTGFLNQVAIEPSIGCTYGKTDAEANARLIAAAPDLLAALELARSTLADHGQQDTDNWPTFQAVCAAIAKATQS